MSNTQKIKNILTLTATKLFSGVRYLVFMFIDGVKNIFKLIIDLFLLIVNTTVKASRKFGVRYVVLFYFTLSVAISAYIFKQDIANGIFLAKIYAQEREIQAMEKEIVKENAEYEKQLRIVKDKLYSIVEKQYNQCVEKEVVSYKKYKLSINEIPDENEIMLATLEAKNNPKCVKVDVNNKVYQDIFNSPFKELLEKEIGVIETKREQEVIKNLAKEEEIKLVANQKALDNNEVKRFDLLDEYKNNVTSNEIKAIFCSFGHGKSMKNPEWNDNGAIMYGINGRPEVLKAMEENLPNDLYEDLKAKDYITERDLLMHINHIACDKIKKEAEAKGVKVYIIGKERNSLKGKIEEINKISEENGYTRDNSIAYELHLNSLPKKPEVNGVEVWYTNKKKGTPIVDGEKYAQRMLWELSQIYSDKELEGRHMFAKNDEISRYGYLGFISSTIPNSLIVEYGFISNEKDVIYNLKNNKKIADSLVNGVMNFANLK